MLKPVIPPVSKFSEEFKTRAEGLDFSPSSNLTSPAECNIKMFKQNIFNFFFNLKGVFAKNERGYWLNGIKKHFWSPFLDTDRKTRHLSIETLIRMGCKKHCFHCFACINYRTIGTVSIISSDYPLIERHVRLITVPFKPLSGQRWDRYPNKRKF